MATGKHPLSEKDANAQEPNPKNRKLSGDDTASKDVRNATAAKEPEQPNKTGEVEDFSKRKPFEYYCIQRPQFDLRKENSDKPKEEQTDWKELYKQSKEANDAVFLKPAAEHRDHKWIAMWDSWKLVCEYSNSSKMCDPGNFKMYISNDFHGYGIQELIENIFESFKKVLLNFKYRDVHALWAIAAGLIQWIRRDYMNPWMGLDDGIRFRETVQLIGITFLEALHDLDRNGKLGPVTPDSTIKDIGLIMSLYLTWGKEIDGCGVSGEELEWRKHIIAYAKKGKIDLVEEGCAGMRATLEFYEKRYRNIPVLKDPGKEKIRWKWKKFYSEFAEDHAMGTLFGLGGEEYQIPKMDRSERAQFAFDKKDPLAKWSDEDLKSGRLMIR